MYLTPSNRVPYLCVDAELSSDMEVCRAFVRIAPVRVTKARKICRPV